MKTLFERGMEQAPAPTGIKASQIVAELQHLIAKYGDGDVFVTQPGI